MWSLVTFCRPFKKNKWFRPSAPFGPLKFVGFVIVVRLFKSCTVPGAFFQDVIFLFGANMTLIFLEGLRGKVHKT